MDTRENSSLAGEREAAELVHEAALVTDDDAQAVDGPLDNIMRRRMGRFLERVNYALADAQDHLTNFDIQSVYVSATVDINGNVSFPLGVGGGLGYSRSIEFVLTPKKKDLPHETVPPLKASVDRDERMRWADAGD